MSGMAPSGLSAAMSPCCYHALWMIISLIERTAGQSIVDSEVNGFHFLRVNPNIMSVSSTGLGIMHMELDLYVPDNILYIDSHSLKTLNLTSMTSSLIAGNTEISGYREGTGEVARFSKPYSFYQQNSSYVIVVDGLNCCIRAVSRLTNTTSWVAGRCTTYGDAIGSFLNTRFAYLAKIVKVPRSDGTEVALVSSYTKFLYGKIQFLFFDESRVTTLSTWWRQLFGLTIRPHTTDAYYSFSGGLGKIGYTNGQNTYLTTTPRHVWDFLDGHFDDARFGQYPDTLLFLDENTFLITDFTYSLLRVADLNSLYVTSICELQPSGQTATILEGDAIHCRISTPRSLLVLPDNKTILIGHRNSLGYMIVSGMGGDEGATTRQTIATTDSSLPNPGTQEKTPSITPELSTSVKTTEMTTSQLQSAQPLSTTTVPESQQSQSTNEHTTAYTPTETTQEVQRYTVAEKGGSVNVNTIIIAAMVAAGVILIGVSIAVILLVRHRTSAADKPLAVPPRPPDTLDSCMTRQRSASDYDDHQLTELSPQTPATHNPQLVVTPGYLEILPNVDSSVPLSSAPCEVGQNVVDDVVQNSSDTENNGGARVRDINTSPPNNTAVLHRAPVPYGVGQYVVDARVHAANSADTVNDNMAVRGVNIPGVPATQTTQDDAQPLPSACRGLYLRSPEAHTSVNTDDHGVYWRNSETDPADASRSNSTDEEIQDG